ALRDERLSASARHWDNYEKFYFRGGASQGVSPADIYRHWMLQLDAPDHTRLRALLNRAFTPRVVEQIRPAIQRRVDDLLDRVSDRAEMELVSELAFPLPLMIIADLLGVPTGDYPMIRRWSEELLPSFGPVMSVAQLQQIGRVMGHFKDYFRGQIARRPAEKTLLARLIAAREGEDRLSEDELLSTCILLIFAGHLSATQLITNGTLLLLSHPDQKQKLQHQPQLIVPAVEEMLRYESPLQVINRTAMTDLEIGGKTIRKGQMVLISLPACNRDPQRFPEPDRFNIERSENRHIAFGYGAHYCAGAPLGRLEAQIALGTLLARFPNMQLTASPIEREPS